MFDTLVQIEVGPTKTVFQMHKGILCNVSAYFKAALEGDLIEVDHYAMDKDQFRTTPGLT